MEEAEHSVFLRGVGVVVFDAVGVFVFKGLQLVVVRGEESLGGDGLFCHQIFCNRPRDRDAVIGARASAYFVHHYQAFLGSVREYVRGLNHFYHKGAESAGDDVACAAAHEDAIDEPDVRLARGDE